MCQSGPGLATGQEVPPQTSLGGFVVVVVRQLLIERLAADLVDDGEVRVDFGLGEGQLRCRLRSFEGLPPAFT